MEKFIILMLTLIVLMLMYKVYKLYQLIKYLREKTMKHFNWKISQDSTETTVHNTNKTLFGDGYEQVVSHGINNSRRAWQCNVTDKKAVIDEIHRFLNETRGVEVFTFTPIMDEPRLKVHLDGEISRQCLGGDVWQLSFNLKQVF